MGNLIKNSKKRKFKDVYKQGKLIGRGSYGSVYEVTLRSDPTQVYAAKIIRLEHLSKKQVQKATTEEVIAMQQLEHENIVRLYDVYQSKKKLVLILEYCRGGTLYDRLTKIKFYSEKNAVDIALQLAKAVEHMHSRGVVHRDLKPENILYETKSSRSAIKLTDFGLSKFLNGNRTMLSACGTPNFVAPEIVMKKPYNEKVDIWSIGIILYVILSGHLPFYSKDLQTLLGRIARSKFTFRPPSFRKVSAFGKVLIKKLLTQNPDDRPSASELVILLEEYKKRANKDIELKQAQQNLRRLNLRKKFKNGILQFMCLDAMYQSHAGTKKFISIMGNLSLVDSTIVSTPDVTTPGWEMCTPPKETGCLLPNSPPSPIVPVSPVPVLDGPQSGL